MIWHCFLYWHVDWNRQEELDKSVGRIMEHPSDLLHILCCTCLIYLPFIAVRDLIFFWRSSTVLRKSPVLTSLLSCSSFELKDFWLTLGSNIVANFNAIPSCPGIEISIISYRLAFRSLRSNLTVLFSQPLIALYFGI